MNWKKKLLALGLSLALTLSLTACGRRPPNRNSRRNLPKRKNLRPKRRMVQRRTLPISELLP